MSANKIPDPPKRAATLLERGAAALKPEADSTDLRRRVAEIKKNGASAEEVHRFLKEGLAEVRREMEVKSKKVADREAAMAKWDAHLSSFATAVQTADAVAAEASAVAAEEAAARAQVTAQPAPFSVPDVEAPPLPQELSVRVVNKDTLGSLQVGCPSSLLDVIPQNARVQAFPDGGPVNLESGLDPGIVQQWLCGDISGRLCFTKLLDAARLGLADHQEVPAALRAREHQFISDHYDMGAFRRGMGILESVAGGFPVYRDGVAEASDGIADLRRCILKCTGGSLHCAGGQLLERVPCAVFNLSVQRECLKMHPQRQQGDAYRYFVFHIAAEALRQQRSGKAQAPSASAGSEQRKASDRDLMRLCSDEYPDPGVDVVGWLRRLCHRIAALEQHRDFLSAALRDARDHDTFGILGIQPGATGAEVTRAYRERARQLHPDRQGSTEAFQELQAAYELLKQRTAEDDSPGSGAGSASAGSRRPRSDDTAARGGAAAPRPEGPRPGPAGAEKGKPADAGQEVRGRTLDAAQEQETPLDFGQGDRVDRLKVEHMARATEEALVWAQNCARLVACRTSVVAASQELALIDASIMDYARKVAFSGEGVGQSVLSSLDDLSTINQSILELCKKDLKDRTPEINRETRSFMRSMKIARDTGGTVLVQAMELNIKIEKAPTSQSKFESLVRKAGEVAVSTTHAMLSLGEEQLRAQRLASVLTAAVTALDRQRRAAKKNAKDHFDGEEPDLEAGLPSPKAPAEPPVERGDPESDIELEERKVHEPGQAQKRVARKFIKFQDLNKQVVMMQCELRTYIDDNPDFIDSVDVKQKEMIFVLLRESLGRARQEMTSILHPTLCQERGPKLDEERSVKALQVLSFLWAAASWTVVAMPSFEARLVRLACLVDAELCQKWIREQFFEPCLGLASGTVLEATLKDAQHFILNALWPLWPFG